MQFRKILIIPFVLAFMLSAIGCDLSDTPESAVNRYLTAIEKLDIETAAKYVSSEEKPFSSESDLGKDPEGEKILRAMTQKMSHKIISSTKSGNTAQVVTSITSPDMLRIVSSVMSDLLPMAFASAFSENRDTSSMDQLAQQYFLNSLSDPNVPLTTQEVTINLIEDNGKWLILADDNLTNALTGNLGKFSEVLNAN